MPLSDDEYTVLLIAKEGESMMPIGRWQPAVESLVRQGYLHRHDKFNNVITDKGRAVVAEHEQGLDDGFFQNSVSVVTTQHDLAKQGEEIAQALANLARLSAKVTGQTPAADLLKWTQAIAKRVKEIL